MTNFQQQPQKNHSFTQQLRDDNREDWDAAVNHRFVDELFSGSLSDQVLAHYLVQDYQFADCFVALLGAAIASADNFGARVRLTRFAAMVTSEENTYFIRAFDHLGVAAQHRTQPPLTAPTQGFQDLMREAAGTQHYAVCLSVLVVAEWLYLSWAERCPATLPPTFVHAEWITLHNNPFFTDFVAWLRAELDRTGPMQDATTQARCADFFSRAVTLERAFFDAAYAPLTYA